MFTSAEFVTPKHPDKICDIIADQFTRLFTAKDPKTKTDIKVMMGMNRILVAGEGDRAIQDYYGPEALKAVIQEVTMLRDHQIQIDLSPRENEQYTDADGNSLPNESAIVSGYATNDTPLRIPVAYMYARGLCGYIYEHPGGMRENGRVMVVCKDEKVFRIVVEFKRTTYEQILKLVRDWMQDMHVPIAEGIVLFLNSAGDCSETRFQHNVGSSGCLTVMDAYGPTVPMGSASFSGKDGSHVCRSGAYRARELAVTLLTTPNVREVFTHLQWAAGEKYPIAMWADLVYRDGTRDQASLIGYEDLDLCTPDRMRDRFFKEPNNLNLASKWGQFGEHPFPWEKEVFDGQLPRPLPPLE